jgi:hypothetical protein
MKILAIGDTHNIYRAAELYGTLLRRNLVDMDTTVVHVGDVGFHVPDEQLDPYIEKMFELFDSLPAGPKMYAIRGNHDNPTAFVGQETDRICLVPDHTLLTLNGVKYAFVGGAGGGIVEEPWGEKEGPTIPPEPEVEAPVDVVVAHDVPQALWPKYEEVLREKQRRAGNTWCAQALAGLPVVEESRKRLNLSLQKYQPRLWINGHYHEDIDITYPSVRVVTINQNSAQLF